MDKKTKSLIIAIICLICVIINVIVIILTKNINLRVIGIVIYCIWVALATYWFLKYYFLIKKQ